MPDNQTTKSACSTPIEQEMGAVGGPAQAVEARQYTTPTDISAKRRLIGCRAVVVDEDYRRCWCGYEIIIGIGQCPECQDYDEQQNG